MNRDDPTPDLVLAIDIGGTKLEVGLVDSAGFVLGRRRAPTASRGPDATHPAGRDVVDTEGSALFDRLAELVGETLSEAETAPVACGIGCGGPMALHGETVSPINIGEWREFPLRSRMRELVAAHVGDQRPVFVDNDAKALALAEGWIGAAAGQTDFMAMVVSTGVGGGIVLDGRLLQGASGNAGHVGHLVVNPGGRVHAGITGTLEGEASGTALAAHLGAPASTADREWRKRTGMLVGRAVGGVANLLDLRLVVVAGSVALGFGEDFFDAAQAEVDQVALLDHSRGARIIAAGLGADGPLIGAAAVAWRGLGRTLGAIAP